jgi:SAM-dependent methyltransferase
MTPASSAGVRQYWDSHIHDLEISSHAPGTRGFFSDLDQYHFEKLHHLLRIIDFNAWSGRDVLDVGCGAGVEIVRFARGGARVTGVDLSMSAVTLARQNVAQQGQRASLACAEGERLPFADNTFDFVYAHGVVQYAADDAAVVRECHRVARPGATVIVQVYNRISWLHVLSTVMAVPLEHEDAPVLRRYSIGELARLMAPFSTLEIIPERFPVRSRLHKGWKGTLFNAGFVGTFNALPRAWVRRFGWHLLAVARK